MTNTTKIIQDITEGTFHSAYAEGPFDNVHEALANEGYWTISLEEQAGLRVREGIDSSVSKQVNWVREGIIYVPKKGVFFTKNSPIIANAKKATDCHRNGNNFYLTNGQVEKSLEDSVKIGKTKIPTERFADEELTSFAFGKNAKAYGEFLKENGIDNLRIWLIDMQDKPLATQAKFGKADRKLGSNLYGFDNDLHCNIGCVRGVHDSSNSLGAPAEGEKPLQSEGGNV
jgi:hypothetical protein